MRIYIPLVRAQSCNQTLPTASALPVVAAPASDVPAHPSSTGVQLRPSPHGAREALQAAFPRTDGEFKVERGERALNGSLKSESGVEFEMSSCLLLVTASSFPTAMSL